MKVMKKMSSYMGIILAALVAVACSKSPEEKESGVEIDHFLGAWMEYYGPDYHIEGSRTWYISKDIISIITYDWYSDTESEKSIRYTLDQKEGKYIIVLHEQEESDTGDESYYIIKLMDEEMIWQSVESEKVHQHFVNSKYWQTHDMPY